MGGVHSTSFTLVFKSADGQTGEQASNGRTRESAKMIAALRGQDIVPAGQESASCYFLASGFACSYRLLNDGRRQITAIHIPGDLIDLLPLTPTSDDAIAALSPCNILAVDRQTIHAALGRNAALAEQLWHRHLVGLATQREWIVSLGRRTALARMAHMFMELITRLQQAGLSKGDACRLPIRQTEFADVLGLSSVHVNRTVQHLRQTRLISWDGETLVVQKPERLIELADFDGSYLRALPQGAYQTSLDLVMSEMQTLRSRWEHALKDGPGTTSSKDARFEGVARPKPTQLREVPREDEAIDKMSAGGSIRADEKRPVIRPVPTAGTASLSTRRYDCRPTKRRSSNG